MSPVSVEDTNAEVLARISQDFLFVKSSHTAGYLELSVQVGSLPLHHLLPLLHRLFLLLQPDSLRSFISGS